MNIPFDTVEGLLQYVFANAVEGDTESVIKAIDKYTEIKRMMHVGDKKGEIIDGVIAKHKPKVLAELGGYFGYSAIRFAFTARKYNPEAHYYSVEYNAVLACVIESLARFAGIGDAITVLIGDLTRTLPKLKQKMKENDKVDQIGFLLLDHVKEDYISDLELAIREGVIKKGSAIVADNIIYPGAPAYKAYMEKETGLYTSTLENVGNDAIIISIVN